MYWYKAQSPTWFASVAAGRRVTAFCNLGPAISHRRRSRVRRCNLCTAPRAASRLYIHCLMQSFEAPGCSEAGLPADITRTCLAMTMRTLPTANPTHLPSALICHPGTQHVRAVPEATRMQTQAGTASQLMRLRKHRARGPLPRRAPRPAPHRCGPAGSAGAGASVLLTPAADAPLIDNRGGRRSRAKLNAVTKKLRIVAHPSDIVCQADSHGVIPGEDLTVGPHSSGVSAAASARPVASHDVLERRAARAQFEQPPVLPQAPLAKRGP